MSMVKWFWVDFSGFSYFGVRRPLYPSSFSGSSWWSFRVGTPGLTTCSHAGWVVFMSALASVRPTSVRLDVETSQRLDRLARRTGRSRAFYLRRAIEEHIDDLEREYDLLAEVEQVRAGRAVTWTLDEVERSLGLEG